jgi:hypothetical protein
MKKSNVFVATTLLAILAGIAGCGGNDSSSLAPASSPVTTSSSEVSVESSITSTVESSSSSKEEVIKTEALTQEMFAELQAGYAVEFLRSTEYDGEKGTTVFYDAQVNDKNYAFKRFMAVEEGDTLVKGKQVEDSHYQINPEEEYEMIYNAGLSIGNTVIYTPVMGRDKYTFAEIELTWEEAGFGNVFKDLSLANFSRVGEENKWELDVNSISGEVAAKIAAQFFGETVSAEIEYFHLLTNGNKITGYDLRWKTYLQYENYVSKYSSGTFYELGENVVDFLKPLEGRAKDADFDNAITALKNYNYKVKHSQAGFDFTTEKMTSRGWFEGECDGDTLNYYYYTANGAKYMNYAYYNVVDSEDGATYLQGATKIKDNFYEDVLYYGSLMDILPSFNISSEMFIKSSESTEDVLVYTLDKSIVISMDNDNATYSSFDSDGYNDRTIYLTVTIDKANNTVNFHNETAATNDSGLVEDVFYSEIGEVETFRTAANTKNNADDLTWEDLFSNDETAYKAFSSKFPASVLENLPTFGGRYAYVNYDQSGIIFVSTYFEHENADLEASYGAKLEAANYQKGSIESSGVTYTTYYTTFTVTSGNRTQTYGLTLTLIPYWNSVLEQGQFQVHISVGSAK